MGKIYSVCWNITERCNEQCEFCYRTLVSDLDLEFNKQIADKLLAHGVEKITLAGGEPLLYNGIFELAAYIKSKKPNVLLSLTTNGLLISEENIERIIELFDWITFDIESVSAVYHEMVGRGKKHFSKNVENLLAFTKRINIKVNTVATKLNIQDIPLVWDLLRKFDVKRWKIFRYYPITYKAKENEDKFAVTDEEYNKLKSRILAVTADSDVQIDFNDYDDFRTTYFSIFPNGTLKDNAGNVTCNILTDSIDECISSIDLSNHLVRRKAFSKFVDKQ